MGGAPRGGCQLGGGVDRTCCNCSMVNQQFPLIAVIITVAPPLIKRFHFFIPNGDELSTASVERSKDRRKINAMFDGVYAMNRCGARTSHH